MKVVRNGQAIPGLIGFVSCCAAMVLFPPVVTVVAALTALVFARSWRLATLSPKRLAAAIGYVMAVLIALLGLLPYQWAQPWAVGLALLGVAAASSNAFLNFCFGCQLHHWWLRLAERRMI